ncbi:MAG: HEAT repeat domain-containing protein [Hamadaea sp.]|nr:HEAT repeat domain-containing protein [Hamadaea sp.]NUR50761.1 HEAT repeat domain-containing protein [Hamadaea sp.]NUT07065.1 HEAT repeat domain-containing protein [Hamadaea sp.]
MTSGNDPLTAVAWGTLHHAYGAADEVPDLVRALASDDEDARIEAHNRLRGTVYHQGTRWEASAYVVPFLVATADEPSTPDRSLVVDLLRLVGLGDLTDRALPFGGFPSFDAGLRSRIRELLPAFYDGELADDDFETMDAAAQVWAADAYAAMARHGDVFRRWLRDPDTEVAARAAELLAWVPTTTAVVGDLIAVPDGSGVRASANLALGHLRGQDSAVLARLDGQLSDPEPMIRWSAAVAVALRTRPGIPPHVRRLLTDERDPRHPVSVPGWQRPLAGFMAVALTPPG